MIKAVLFDLDGTLLPMDQEIFVKAYFKGMTQKVAYLGYKPDKLIESIWAGTKQMVLNDGSKTNKEVFWQAFEKIFGDRVFGDMPVFDDFYINEFNKGQDVCGFNEKSKEIIEMLKEKNVRLILATNPLFPKIATENRIRWAGLSEEDFELVTTYENTSYCKPNPEYYKDILKRTDLKAEECIMVGNDVSEDMIAETLGLKVFLLTDCIINKENKDISVYPNGNFDALSEFLKKCLTI